MPDYPSWIERVPQIRATLLAPSAPPFLDRAAVEQLFGLRRRQAIALLGRCGGYQLGRTYLASREAVLAFLAQPGPALQQAQTHARRQRVQQALREAPPVQAARPIVVAPETGRCGVAGLPAGIQLVPGQVTLRFSNPEELLTQLYALAQTLLADYDDIATQVQVPPDAGSP